MENSNTTTSTCVTCGLVMNGDRYRCMKCFYQDSFEADYFN